MGMNRDHEPMAAAAPSLPPLTTRPCVSLRSENPLRKPWVAATGSPTTRRSQATYYLLQAFDYKESWLKDHAEVSLAKVVCNLRNYYRLDADATTELVQEHFNPRTVFYDWSAEAIRLTWELVEGFTPTLGLRDEKARAKQRQRALEDEVLDLLAWVKLGGRVLDDDLLKVFRDWNPHMEVTANAFSRAVASLTGGIPKRRSNGQGYWEGFHIPTAEELALEAQQVA